MERRPFCRFLLETFHELSPGSKEEQILKLVVFHFTVLGGRSLPAGNFFREVYEYHGHFERANKRINKFQAI